MQSIRQINIIRISSPYNTPAWYTIKLFIIFIFFSAFSLSAFSQSLETATEKYNAGDLTGAEEETKALLKKDSNNIDAIELLNRIETAIKKNKSEVLTKKALIEIDNRNFNTAFDYLKQAILLDPENDKARELYLSIKEVTDIEQTSEEEQKNLAAKTAAPTAPGKAAVVSSAPARAGETAPGISQGETALGNKKEQPAVITPAIKAEKQAPLPKKTPSEKKKQGNIVFLKLSPSYTFAYSNNLSYIDSHVSFAGSRLEADYFFDFLMRLVGISLDYSGLFLKATGSQYINFMVHSLDASLVLRLFMLKDSFGNTMTLGTKLNYHFFYLYNLASAGVYDFVNLYAPSIGIFISDPVISRIIRIGFLKNLGFEGSFNFLYLIGQANAPYSYVYYTGLYYKLNSFKFTAGFRSRTITDSSTLEIYNSIEAGAGFSIK